MADVAAKKEKVQAEAAQVQSYLQRAEAEAAAARKRLAQLEGKLEAYAEDEVHKAEKAGEAVVQEVEHVEAEVLRKVASHPSEKTLKK